MRIRARGRSRLVPLALVPVKIFKSDKLPSKRSEFKRQRPTFLLLNSLFDNLYLSISIILGHFLCLFSRKISSLKSEFFVVCICRCCAPVCWLAMAYCFWCPSWLVFYWLAMFCCTSLNHFPTGWSPFGYFSNNFGSCVLIYLLTVILKLEKSQL